MKNSSKAGFSVSRARLNADTAADLSMLFFRRGCWVRDFYHAFGIQIHQLIARQAGVQNGLHVSAVQRVIGAPDAPDGACGWPMPEWWRTGEDCRSKNANICDNPVLQKYTRIDRMIRLKALEVGDAAVQPAGAFWRR